MLLLCLDTSTPAVTVALVEDGEVRAESTEVDARRHGELLAPAVSRVLAEAGVGPSSLTAVAAGLGPGPFTGLRVGLVTATTLADALGIPAYGTCSLDLVATDGSGSYAVATDARRREVYWAVYSGQSRVDGPYVDRPAAVAERLRAAGVPRVVGAGARLHAADFDGLVDPAGPEHPRAAALWDRVADRARRGAPGDPLTPLYLRRPDATEPAARPKPVSQPTATAASRSGATR